MTLAPDNIASSIGWELFSHDADVGVRGFGATVAEAFEGAALALTAVITDARIEPNTRVDVACEAPDIELLLVEWLNAVIYEMAVRHMIFGRFAVEIEDTRLRGTRARGSEAACPSLRAERGNLYCIAGCPG